MVHTIIAAQVSNKPKAKTILPDNLICFSHLRWDFVFQRPQHLLTRMGKTFAVYFIEEPIFDSSDAHYTLSEKDNNITVVVPHLPHTQDRNEIIRMQKELLDEFMASMELDNCAFWYYTPMALQFSRHLKPAITIFDCMDELSAFKFAPQELKDLEKELMSKADVVFTGGHSLYNAKKDHHENIHAFPSSVDKEHFSKARHITAMPGDQARIAAPRIGFFGVIDERFDMELIKTVAERQPHWHIILLGPIVKIDPMSLPQLDNIHYLGSKSYSELPDYIAGWDIAMIPFLLNESTQFISPTKTPEYLSAGVPVISTAIRDVIHPYGNNGLVAIVETADDFIAAAKSILHDKTADRAWLEKTDRFLSNLSWDHTVNSMLEQIEKVSEERTANAN
jgi:UDP-galactopyranose mutase